MKCKECEYYYYGDTHDGLNNRPSCRKGYIPFVDVECKSFKKIKKVIMRDLNEKL